MIVYSVTVSVDKTVEADWLNWMKTVHIPDVMATGYFVESHFHALLYPEPQEPGSETYNIQYLCKSIDEYNAYQEKEAPRLQKEHIDRYQQKCLAFRTLLSRI